MDDLRYQQAKKLFLDVCDLGSEERKTHLSAAGETDPALRAEVESLLGEHDRANAEAASESKPLSERATIQPMSERATVQPMSGRATVASGPTRHVSTGREKTKVTKIGPYRIIHELGRGGMGLVYLGEKETGQFKRRVAIKVLKRGMDTEDILRRFKLEEQLLASLNHPGIARLFDAGETDEGLPYFAMEYIEGSDLESYCDAHRLNVQERLALFVKVCEAVHYAHQNLVVHRDLKPGNIIVTADGQPKLLDFGIAKLINPALGQASGDPTAPEFRVMTPEYASPEQVRGNPITTASDVYSLGVMLYELLSGHAPYKLQSRARPELERVICEEDPERPSTAVSKIEETHWVNPTTGSSTITPESVSRTRESRPDRLRRSLAGDLDNIVLMAMRKEPQRRYASAEQMAEDIQRHLDGMPVIARPDTLGYRTSKFVTRNRAGVAAAAVIAVLLVGGITGTTSGWAAAEHRRAEIQEAWTAAEVQHARAEAHLNQIIAVSDEMLVKMHAEIQTLDGSLEARRTLIEIAMGFLTTVEEEVRKRPELRAEVALAHHRIAGVFGGIRNPTENDTGPALEHYRTSLDIRQKLLAADPENAVFLGAVASSHEGIGDVLRRTGKVTEALAAYRQQLRIRERLVQRTPDDPDARRLLAIALVTVGDGLFLVGDKAGAVDHYNRSLPIRKKLAAERMDVSDYQRDVAVISGRIGGILQDEGRYEEALVRFEDAVRIRQRLADSNLDNSRWRRDLAWSRYFVGMVQIELGDLQSAEISLREMMAVMTQRSAAAPRNARATSDLAEAHHAIGVLHAMRCEWEPAMEHYQTFFATIAPLSEGDPNNTFYRTLLAQSRERVGQALAARRELENAVKSTREAFDIVDQLAYLDDADMRSKENLAHMGLELGRQLARTGAAGRSEALARLMAARDLYRTLLEGMPLERSIQTGLADTLGVLADLMIERSDAEQALALTSEALAIPPRPRDVPRILHTQARAQTLAGNTAAAAQDTAEALKRLDALPYPDCDDLRKKLGG